MAISYDVEALNEICNQIDLFEYAQNNMDFKKHGKDSYATHCPLHKDKTPSLFITPSKNMFHCFSCKAGGNILNWLMTYEHMSFSNAIEKIEALSGVDISEFRQCNALKIFKTLRRFCEINNPQDKNIDRKVLNISEMGTFDDEIPYEWIEEGISQDVMRIFDIRIDKSRNRIVYPVYDRDFKLIGFKGRTRYSNFKELDIKKYMNYQKIGTTDFFVGMKEQVEQINNLKKVIVFEGIKSVLKAFGWGYQYTIAAETSCLNDEQVKILIQMGIKDITIAFDTDVPLEKIIESCNILKKFSNVYVISDRKLIKDKLLGEKDSPVDRGKKIFEVLLAERRKI